ncbi:hypothetical protein BJV82DRAFT_631874 [Fennellomyces sp. T-0311]|nr:hypothetical protein BJV82DRAFT_631874 [Fennellomyces sp. T-0311]
MSQVNSIIGEENVTIDKLGNTRIEEDTEDAGQMSRHRMRNEQRRANNNLGGAVSPPDRRRGHDKGLNDNWTKSSSEGNDTLVSQQDDLPPMTERQGDFGYNNGNKKVKQGWGDPIEAQIGYDEMDPNDPAAEGMKDATATSAGDDSNFKTMDEYHPQSVPKNLGRMEPRAPNSVNIDPSQEPKNAKEIRASTPVKNW